MAKLTTTTKLSSKTGRSLQTVQEHRTDRRVERTRNALRAALYQAVREGDWDSIHVGDICARANVGRSTFYLHFADKEELLLSGFADLRAALTAEAATHPDDPLAFASSLLAHTHAHSATFAALRGRRSAQLVHRTFVDTLAAVLRESFAATCPDVGSREAAARYIAGAFWELCQWRAERRGPSLAQVEAVFRRLTTPVLRELGREMDSGL